MHPCGRRNNLEIRVRVRVRVRVTELVFSQIGFTTGVIVQGAERGL